MSLRRLLFAALVALAAAALPAGAVDHHVAVGPGAKFTPSDLLVAPGDRVIWTRYGAVHGVAADDGSFGIPVGDDWTTLEHVFSEPGNFEYFSPVYSGPNLAQMNGVIRVGGCVPSSCVPDANTLCLAGGSGTPNRFRVRVVWTDFENNTGPGVALSYTADSGFFYFFNSQILELLVKIVNGCGFNNAYWFYYGSTSNVGLVYTVEDLQTCTERTVDVPIGTFASNGDIEFFQASCP